MCFFLSHRIWLRGRRGLNGLESFRLRVRGHLVVSHQFRLRRRRRRWHGHGRSGRQTGSTLVQIPLQAAPFVRLCSGRRHRGCGRQGRGRLGTHGCSRRLKILQRINDRRRRQHFLLQLGFSIELRAGRGTSGGQEISSPKMSLIGCDVGRGSCRVLRGWRESGRRRVLFRLEQRARRLESISHLINEDWFAQNGIGASLQGFRHAGVIAHDRESKRALVGLAGASGFQQIFGIFLVVPIGNDDLKRFAGHSADCGSGVGTVIGLCSQIRQCLADERGRSFVRREDEAAQIHAHSD